MHGAHERLLGPGADPGLGIGRDVGGVDGAERGRQRQAAGKGPPARRGVANAAVAETDERGAPLDQGGIEARGIRRSHGRNLGMSGGEEPGSSGGDQDDGEDDEECSLDHWAFRVWLFWAADAAVAGTV